MFFITDFLEDLYYGATSVAYDLTHPDSWPSVASDIRSEGYSKEAKKDMEELEKILEMIGGGDSKEIINLLKEIKDPSNLTPEEEKKLIDKLKNTKITIDFSKLAEMMEKKEEKKEPVPEAEAPTQERVTLKEAVMQTPLGKQLFEHIDKEEEKKKKGDAVAQPA